MAQTPEGSDPFDVPLLREIQRVLLAGGGPVNWELARQVGIAGASWGQPDAEPSDEDARALAEHVRMAELAVAEVTGLAAPAEVAHARAVRRAAWVEGNVRGLQGLFEPGAERLARALADAGPEEPAEAAAGTQMFDALLDRIAPLLMGAQVGTVLGALGQRVLGQYDLPLPRGEPPALLFVVPNIVALEREWSLEPVEFRAWVALHETAHAFQLGRPWVREHVLGMVRELAQGMEFDLSGLEQRLEGLDLSNPQQLSEALTRPGTALEGTLTDDQRLLLRRMRAFVAAAEGHADHLVERVGRRLLRSFDRIDEALRRRREGRGDDERAVERMLGIELNLEDERLGRRFCDRVSELTDERTLARMWEAPEALPSMPELEEPTLWLSRIA
ncbi:MAG TPA: zinc-dependent metalloprotease [Actinomycetota bacterium]|nr:zinc-dependent metalloprotease [Actinomycetota bacterium]